MTKSTNQRRTAASILEDIRKRLANEEGVLTDARAQVSASLARLMVLQQILDGAEKNGSDDE